MFNFASADEEIKRLITIPKQISDPPSKTWRIEERHKRKDFRLVSTDGELRFRGFARQNVTFPENFSIGLEYEPEDGSENVVLMRCNGPHGDFNRSANPSHPHFYPHIHTASEAAMEAGEKPESRAAVTQEYLGVKEAMRYFLNAVSLDLNDQTRYFEDDLRITLFDTLESEA